MAHSDVAPARIPLPAPAAILELLKPLTWFAPMWAYMCGVVSSGVPLGGHWQDLIGGVVLAGPLLCGTSQAVNDWFDRHVDAINEPQRPIPSGRIPGRWGLYIAVVWTALSLGWALWLGPWLGWAALLGMALAWAYSAPPLRLKRSGWLGPTAVALSYEGLAWFAGAAVMLRALPNDHVLFLAAAYSVGAHGIMVLNDFKATDGDARMGIRSLPVTLGAGRAAALACAVMALPQAVVVLRVLAWGEPYYALGVAVLLVAQLALMPRLLRDPKAHAPWYNATGTSLYVLGMLTAAFAVHALGTGVS